MAVVAEKIAFEPDNAAGATPHRRVWLGPWLHPVALELLYLRELARIFLFYRNRRRRELSQHRLAFNERIWREAADTLGAAFEPLGSNISEINLKGRRTRVDDYRCEIDSPVTCALLHDKLLVHRILSTLGLSVPRHASFSIKSITIADAFLTAAGKPCVVKPALGGAGRGVTTGVCGRRDLARAAAAATVFSDELLIEEQIPGENYRLLYLDGELIDAVVRRPPTVVGDGHSTIAHLLRRENEQRVNQQAALSQALITVDLDMRQTLRKQNFSLHSVPAEGRLVTLKTVINDNCGRDNSTVTHLLHASIVEAGQSAVRELRVRFAGVDLIAPDISVPLSESGGAFIEVNPTPGLYYHYTKRDGPFPAAAYILRRLLLDDMPYDARRLEGSFV